MNIDQKWNWMMREAKKYKSGIIPEKVLRENRDKIEPTWLLCTSFKHHYSEKFLEDMSDVLTWKEISRHQQLKEEFIRKHKDDVDWVWISMNQKLSLKFIREFADYISWFHLSYKKFPEYFLREFADKFEWTLIFFNQKTLPSLKMFLEYGNKINWYEVKKLGFSLNMLIEQYGCENVNKICPFKRRKK